MQLSNHDTDSSPYDSGAYASRQSYVTGGAVKQTALMIKEKLIDYASKIYDVEKNNIKLENETFINKESDREIGTIGDVCVHMNFINDLKTKTDHITCESTFTASNVCFSYGACYTDLEVDVLTGKVNLKKIYANEFLKAGLY